MDRTFGDDSGNSKAKNSGSAQTSTRGTAEQDSHSKLADDVAVHGGLSSSNPYYNWLQLNANEEGMGRDMLRRTSPITDEECMLTEGFDTIMGAVTPVGTDGLRVSKWSK